jgi:urease accessory protein
MQNFHYAKASKEIGANYLKQIDFGIQKQVVKEYFLKVKEGVAFGNELAVLSAYGYELDISPETFLLLWSKKTLLNIAMSSLKISRIKPSEIQRTLLELEVDSSGEKHLSNFNPLFEEIIYRHKDLEPKLFVT